MDLLSSAIAFATKKHQGQTRKGTTVPYITHPLEALSIAATLTDDPEILAAAVLHDVMEDCGVSFARLKQSFGLRVAELVAADSEDKQDHLPAADTWKARKEHTLKQLETMPRDAKIIVLADKLSNIRAIYRDYVAIGDDLWQRFNCKSKKEQGWYYDRIRVLLQSDFVGTAAIAEYADLVGRVFSAPKWYEVLIQEKFINYFSDPDSVFFIRENGKTVSAPLYKEFEDIIHGLTLSGVSVHFLFMPMSPAVREGYIAIAGSRYIQEGFFARIWQSIPDPPDGGKYHNDPEQLTPEQLAMLIIYPFWSRMGGPWNEEFTRDGRLKTYLLTLHKKNQARKEAEKNVT